MVLSSPALLAGRKVEEIGGYPATFHVRDFLDCVKTRGKPKGNAVAACNAHLACHAANIAIFLGAAGEARPGDLHLRRRRGGQPAAVGGPAGAVARMSHDLTTQRDPTDHGPG